MIIMHVRPRQTDRRANIMAIARRFVLTNASRTNNKDYNIQSSMQQQLTGDTAAVHLGTFVLAEAQADVLSEI